MLRVVKTITGWEITWEALQVPNDAATHALLAPLVKLVVVLLRDGGVGAQDASELLSNHPDNSQREHFVSQDQCSGHGQQAMDDNSITIRAVSLHDFVAFVAKK